METNIIREFIKIQVNKGISAPQILNASQRMAELEELPQHNRIKKIYFAHPYNNDPSNILKIEAIIKSNYIPGMIPLSPIHSFGFMYSDYPYEEGMFHCMSLLHQADELWLFGNWKESRGCKMEKQYAETHGIKIRYFEDTDTNTKSA